MTDRTLRAGAARVDITPDTPQWLDGFGNRTEPSAGVYLPLAVRALALRQDDATALLLSAEVLAFDRDRTAALKGWIAAATGVPVEAIILAATHTHCAPRVCNMTMPGQVDPLYVDRLETACVEAAAEAVGALAPARAFVSRTSDDHLGVNRRVLKDGGVAMLPNPSGPHDRDVDTLWLESDSDRNAPLLASVTIVACHPTSRGGELVGGDYPGFLSAELESRAGGVALFLLGAAGDVRPSFQTDDGRFRMASIEEVSAAGTRLAEAALAARGESRPVTAERLAVVQVRMDAPLETPPSREEWIRMAAEDPNPLTREWAARQLAQPTPASIPFEMQALSLGKELTLLCWPGEVASEFGLWAKDTLSAGEGAPAGLMVAAYCNGAVGYVSTRRMYGEGGYEVRGSHIYYNLPAAYAPEMDEQLRETTRALLRRLPPSS